MTAGTRPRHAPVARRRSNPVLPSAAELLELLDALPASVALWDEDVRLRYGNRRSLTRFGRPVSELAGVHLSDVVLAQAVELSRPYIEGALAGRAQQVDRAMVDARGRRYNAHQVTHTPNLPGGAARGYCALAVDITASVEGYDRARRAREATATRAERDRIAGDIGNQQVMDKLVSALERLDAAIGRASDLLPDLATAAEAIDTAIAELRSTVPARLEKTDEGVVPYPRVPAPADATNAVVGAGWPQDITGAGWSAEQACAVLDLLPAEVAIWDQSLCNVFANRAAVRWFGRADRREVIGRPAEELLGAELLEAANIAYAEAALRGAPQQVDCTVGYPGGLRHLQVYCAPRRRGDRPEGIFSFVIDVTDRVDAELELQQARVELAGARMRARIADRLHNLVIQRLFAAGLAATANGPTGTDQGQQARSVQDGILAALGDLDSALTALDERPELVDLLPDLARLVHSVADPRGLAVNLETIGPVEYVSPDASSELLTAAEGAMAQVVEVCDLERVVVTIAADAHQVRLRVAADAATVLDWRMPLRWPGTGSNCRPSAFQADARTN